MNSQEDRKDAKCDLCGRRTEPDMLRAAVVDGRFYQNVCDVDRGAGTFVPLDAEYQKARAREDYGKETLQPFDANGRPVADFFIAYPDKLDMLTPQEQAAI